MTLRHEDGQMGMRSTLTDTEIILRMVVSNCSACSSREGQKATGLTQQQRTEELL